MTVGAVVGFALLAAVAALVRFEASQRLNTESFPSGTLVVNVIAALGAGLLTSALTSPGELIAAVPDDVIATMVIGAALGSMSTYSAFAVEAAEMARSGAWTRAGSYVGITIVCTVGAAAIGLTVS